VLALFKPVFSLAEYLESIISFHWAAINLVSPYLPDDYPNSYPFSKDTDIIVYKDEFYEFVNHTETFLRAQCEMQYDVCVISDAEYRCKIRVELQGFLIHLIDVYGQIEGIKSTFLKQCIARRVSLYEHCFVPAIEDELCFRAREFLVKKKDKHLDFISKHKHKLSQQKFQEAFEKGNVVYLKINQLL